MHAALIQDREQPHRVAASALQTEKRAQSAHGERQGSSTPPVHRSIRTERVSSHTGQPQPPGRRQVLRTAPCRIGTHSAH